jgi:predicted metal-dependent phosphotriesterase family hydrolase
MPQVQTVLGPVAADALGRVLMHEHVFVLTADVQQNYPTNGDRKTTGSPTRYAA